MYITYHIVNNKPIIDIFENGKYTKISDFKPYFYIEYKTDKSGKIVNEITDLLEIYKNKIVSYKKADRVGFPDNKPIIKIFTKIPKDVSELKEEFHKAGIKTYEADILFPIRYLIDKNPEIKQVENIVNLDIENQVLKNNVFEKPENARMPITVICIFSYKLNKYISFTWRKDIEEKVIKMNNWSKYYFDNEKSMLHKFLEFWDYIKPEIIIGWNVNGYDMTYIYNRLKRLNITPELLSPMKYVNKAWRNEGIDIKGIFIIDLLKEYGKFHGMTFYPSLDYAAEKEGFQKKLEININNAWENDIEKLLEYNKHDVEIVQHIEDKYKLIQGKLMWHYLSLSSGVQIDSLEYSRLADFILLKYARQNGFALPSKIHELSTNEMKNNGGKVHAPKKGLHKNIAVFDFSGMYPTIDINFNLGKDTIIPINQECVLCIKNCKNNNSERCVKFENTDILTLPNKVKFYRKSNRKAIMSDIIKKLFKIRKEYKDEMKKAFKKNDLEREDIYNKKQTQIKFFTNAFSYGIFAYKNFRLYDAELGATITDMGQMLNIESKDYIEKLGYNVVAGDTDSIFIEIENTNKAEILVKKVEDYLNNWMDKKYGIEDKFGIEFEKFYSKLLLLAKKRYMGFISYKDGIEVNNLFEYKGIEMKRQDAPKFVQKLQKKIGLMILNEEKSEDILNYIEEIKNKLRCGDYEINDIGSPGNMNMKIEEYKNKPSHVSAVLYSKEFLNIDIKEREKYLYSKFKGKGWVAWKSDKKLPDNYHIDIDYIINLYVNGLTQRLLEPAGIGMVKSQDISEFF